jgi:lipopolysaccharide/colanic/teichoic acid biosynthesis glycosyltransferase
MLSPLLLLLTILLLAFQGRPVLYCHHRIGLNGVPFRLNKFRTMRAGDSDDPHEARVTGIGRILRRFGIDEVPQLVNIVRGEMSFVGPRPALPEQVARYGNRERRRLSVYPGITGWAQIHGRNAISWDQRITLDLWYIENRSLGLDLRILWSTLAVILTGRGVYGRGGRNPDFQSADSTMTEAV